MSAPKPSLLRRLARPLAVAACAACAVAFPALAGPADPAHVAADAKWFIHLDVDAAKQTDVYKQVLDAARAQFPVDDVVAQLKAGIGVNPLTDIAGITVYNTSFEKDVAAILIYAKVDRALLIQAIAQNPDYKTIEHGRHTLNTWTDQNDGKSKAGCFYGDGLIVMADKVETLKAAVNVLDGANKSGSPLVKSPPKGAFLYASADLAQSNDANVSQLVSASEAATAWAGETGGNFVLHLNLAARTADQATDIRNMIEGAKSFAARLASRDVPTAAALIRKVQVAVDGEKVAASFEHDAKTLLQTLQQIDAEKKKAAAGKADGHKGL